MKKYKPLENDKKFDIKKCHEYLIDTYQKFILFCSQIGIKPFLLWGTLLGAKRTGKIIPWDDDIDLGLIEDEFILLVEHREELKQHGLDYIFYKDDKKAYSHEIRIYQPGFYKLNEGNFRSYIDHVCIDIFPSFKVSRDLEHKEILSIEKSLQKNLALLIQKSSVWMSKSKVKGFLREIKRWLLVFVPFGHLHKNVEKTLQKLNGSSTNYGYCFPETLHNKNRHLDIFDSVQFENLDSIEFEGISSFVPLKSDDFLDFVYGDWHSEKDRSQGKVFDEIFILRK